MDNEETEELLALVDASKAILDADEKSNACEPTTPTIRELELCKKNAVELVDAPEKILELLGELMVNSNQEAQGEFEQALVDFDSCCDCLGKLFTFSIENALETTTLEPVKFYDEFNSEAVADSISKYVTFQSYNSVSIAIDRFFETRHGQGIEFPSDGCAKLIDAWAVAITHPSAIDVIYKFMRDSIVEPAPVYRQRMRREFTAAIKEAKLNSINLVMNPCEELWKVFRDRNPYAWSMFDDNDDVKCVANAHFKHYATLGVEPKKNIAPFCDSHFMGKQKTKKSRGLAVKVSQHERYHRVQKNPELRDKPPKGFCSKFHPDCPES